MEYIISILTAHSLGWYIFIILFAIVYLFGIFTVKTLDEMLPEENRKGKYHTIILGIMWIFTPVILVAFVIYLVIKKFQAKKLKAQN